MPENMFCHGVAYLICQSIVALDKLYTELVIQICQTGSVKHGNHIFIMVSIAPDKRGYTRIFFLLLHGNIYCGYSLEALGVVFLMSTVKPV